MSNIFAQKTETPEYKVLKKLGKIEIREYPELIMASTIMGKSYGGNSGKGFSTVAGYIFGGNEKSEKISMTSPVVVDMADTMKMSFIMPSKYEMDDLPRPSNPKVELHKEKSKILAVLSFSGWANDNKLDEYKEMLSNELKKHNLIPLGEYMYFGYNPPFKMINRRNEVAVEIESWVEK
ncbi:MAG: heme-binding protein [Bacteroidota bacterium]|nr:heme-binding protein [Bacteroidota bacterium]